MGGILSDDWPDCDSLINYYELYSSLSTHSDGAGNFSDSCMQDAIYAHLLNEFYT